MDYKDEIQEFLKEFEKKFSLKLEDLNWVEQRLDKVYHYGYDDGQKSHSKDDYDEGYSVAKDYYQNEKREDEAYDEGYDEGYADAKKDFGIKDEN